MSLATLIMLRRLAGLLSRNSGRLTTDCKTEIANSAIFHETGDNCLSVLAHFSVV